MSTTTDRLRSAILRNGLLSLSSTWRFTEEIPADCRDAVDGREPAVIAFWHGSMLPVWYRFRQNDATAMVSGSRDGELLAGYLSRLGYCSIIRGSSSRGGSEALTVGVEQLATRSLLITPDGPRGPREQAKPGALIAAVRSRRRILLVGCTTERAIQTSSWDRMAIPLPFSTIVLRYCIFAPSLHRTSQMITQVEVDDLSARLSSLSQPLENRSLRGAGSRDDSSPTGKGARQ